MIPYDSITAEQYAVIQAREWRKNRLLLSERVAPINNRRAIEPKRVACSVAPKQDTGTSGQVSTNGETGFYSWVPTIKELLTVDELIVEKVAA